MHVIVTVTLNHQQEEYKSIINHIQSTSQLKASAALTFSSAARAALPPPSPSSTSSLCPSRASSSPSSPTCCSCCGTSSSSSSGWGAGWGKNSSSGYISWKTDLACTYSKGREYTSTHNLTVHRITGTFPIYESTCVPHLGMMHSQHSSLGLRPCGHLVGEGLHCHGNAAGQFWSTLGCRTSSIAIVVPLLYKWMNVASKSMLDHGLLEQ